MDHEEWQNKQKTTRVSTEKHEFEVAYAEFGSGEPVTVFLHGIPTWSFLFRDVCDSVEHAIIPDIPGYGFTKHLNSGGFDRSVRAQEEYVRAFLDELGIESAQIVAHDTGGAVALGMAIRTDIVERLVLSQATCYDSWPVESITSLGLPNKARTMSYADVEEELKLKFKNGTYCDKRATAEFVNGMIAPWIHPEFEVSRLSRAAIATDTNHTLELAPHHSNISAPTLLLWASPGGGQHAEYARQLADDIPQAEIQWIHRASHWVMQDRPDAYRKGVQDFLDNKSA